MKRLRKLLQRITGIPRRCRAPLRSSRPNMSLRYALWSFISGTVGILAIVEVTTLVGHSPPEFILVPVLLGAAILLLVALFTNNVVYHRSYPKHWL